MVFLAFGDQDEEGGIVVEDTKANSKIVLAPLHSSKDKLMGRAQSHLHAFQLLNQTMGTSK